MEKPHVQGLKPLETGVNLCINGIVVTNPVSGILYGSPIADAVNQTFVVTMNMDGTLLAGEEGVVLSVLKKEAQDSIDPIGFGQA